MGRLHEQFYYMEAGVSCFKIEKPSDSRSSLLVHPESLPM